MVRRGPGLVLADGNPARADLHQTPVVGIVVAARSPAALIE